LISLSPYEVVIADGGSAALARKIVVSKSDVINPVSVVLLPTDRNVMGTPVASPAHRGSSGIRETMAEVLYTYQ
jgi:hypothetical protein